MSHQEELISQVIQLNTVTQVQDNVDLSSQEQIPKPQSRGIHDGVDSSDEKPQHVNSNNHSLAHNPGIHQYVVHCLATTGRGGGIMASRLGCS